MMTAARAIPSRPSSAEMPTPAANPSSKRALEKTTLRPNALGLRRDKEMPRDMSMSGITIPAMTSTVPSIHLGNAASVTNKIMESAAARAIG